MTESAFGDLLRRARVAAGLTQEELAERAGLSTRGISDLERGAREVPRKDTLEMLLGALDLSATDRAPLVAAARRPPAAQQSQGGDRRSLPIAPTPLVGREDEVAALGVLLTDPRFRLVTLTGPGGVGKTHLALAMAERLRTTFPDGLFFIALAPIRDPALVASAIAQQIGVREEAGLALSEQIAARLAGARVLLVLDNFEHLLASASLVAELLARAATVKVLATSREPLHLRGEREFAVLPLALPDLQQSPDPDELAQNAAVRLFVERARDVRSDFTLTSTNASAVADICHRLDGLPLALELAAARVKILSPAALQARLDRRLQLLTGGPQDLPDRQRTLRDTISWSFELLSPDEQILLCQLAVFDGGCTLDAAATITGSDDLEILEGLASLVDKHLLRQETVDGGEPRFTMLETVAEFGREHMATSEEFRRMHRAHALYFAVLVSDLRPRIDGPDQMNVIARLEAEQDNIRAALRWAIEQQDATTALRLTANLWKFWLVHGHLREGRDWLERSLVVPGDVQLGTRIDALYGAGSFARLQGDYGRAAAHGEEALALARFSKSALHAARSLYLLGRIAQDQSDLDRTRRLYEEAISPIREAQDHHFEAMILNNLGDVIAALGQPASAQEHYENALAIWRQRQDTWGIGIALLNLGYVALQESDAPRAGELFGEGLATCAAVGDQAVIADYFDAIGRLATACHQWLPAAQLLSAATSLYHTVGIKQFPGHRAEHERALAAAQSALGDGAFAAARQEGECLTVDEAVDKALAISAEAHTCTVR